MKKILSLALATVFAVSAMASTPSIDSMKKKAKKHHHGKKSKDTSAKM